MIDVLKNIALVSTDPTIPAPTIVDIIPKTKKYFSGAVEIGEDLMIIEIADSVLIKKFNTKKNAP